MIEVVKVVEDVLLRAPRSILSSSASCDCDGTGLVSEFGDLSIPVCALTNGRRNVVLFHRWLAFGLDCRWDMASNGCGDRGWFRFWLLAACRRTAA